MAKKANKDSAAKNKADRKGNRSRGNADAARGASIASHPRAHGSIRQMKAWAGLAGFLLATLLSIQASVPLFQVGLRALGAGVVGYMLAWWFSVLIWRQLIVAEQRAALEAIQRRRAEEPDKRAAEAQPTA